MDVREGVHWFHLAHYLKWSSLSCLYEHGTELLGFVRAGNLTTRSVTVSEVTVL